MGLLKNIAKTVSSAGEYLSGQDLDGDGHISGTNESKRNRDNNRKKKKSREDMVNNSRKDGKVLTDRQKYNLRTVYKSLDYFINIMSSFLSEYENAPGKKRAHPPPTLLAGRVEDLMSDVILIERAFPWLGTY